MSARYEANLAAGMSRIRADGTEYDPETDRQSLAAETYVCGRFGVPVQPINLDGTLDPGYDFVLADGRTVDVKWVGTEHAGSTRPRFRGHVIANPGKLRADLYVVVVGSFEAGFCLAGWSTRADFEERERKNFGYGKKHAIPLDDLNWFEFGGGS